MLYAPDIEQQQIALFGSRSSSTFISDGSKIKQAARSFVREDPNEGFMKRGLLPALFKEFKKQLPRQTLRLDPPSTEHP